MSDFSSEFDDERAIRTTTITHVINCDHEIPSRRMKFPKVYVLTRTSGRKHFFHENYLSIQNQNYPYICQLVSYDDDETSEYVNQYTDLHFYDYDNDPTLNPHELRAFQMNRIKPTTSSGPFGKFPYNLYLNSLMDEISKMEPGWIMILDDDDLMISNRSVMTMVTWIKKENVKPDQHFLMWQVEFPNGRLVPKNIGRQPRMGDVSMIGFMFHSMWIPKLRFENRKGGDYLMMRKLYDFLDPVWVPDVLTRVNYDSIRRFGSGRRRDKSFSAGQIKEYKLFWENKMTKEKKTISLVKKKSNESSLVLDEDSLGSLSVPDQNVEEMSDDDSLGLDDSLDLGENFDLSPNLKLKLKTPEGSEESDSEIKDEDNLDEEDQTEEQKMALKLNFKKHATFQGAKPETCQTEPRDISDTCQGEIEYTQNDDDQVVQHQNDDDDEMVIHPHLEKLLDLLSDESKVQIVPLRDLRNDIQTIVKQTVNDCLRGILHQSKSQEVAPSKDRLTFKKQLHRAIEDDSSISQPSSDSKQVKLTRGNVDTIHRREVRKSLKRQLSELIEDETSEQRRLSKLLVNYAEDDNSPPVAADIAPIDGFLDKVYIINIGGHASELQYKLESFGFMDIQVVDFNKKKKDFWGNLWELMKVANKKGYHRIGVFQDNIHLHKNFQEEISFHMDKFAKKDWKMIAISAISSLTTKSALDWKYYLKTYPDLQKSGRIKDESAAQKHWKLNGARERRYGSHDVLHPDSLAGVTAVFINARFYKDLAKLQKARDPRAFILRNYKTQTYATSPLLAISPMNRMVRMRNRHNLEFYEIDS